MTETETPLDAAHAEMDASDAARLRFFERLADAELMLLLASAPDDGEIVPEIFELQDGPVVLVFDREERLADFVGGPASHAVLSGRRIARLLAGRGIGLGLNLGSAPSAMLLPPAAVDWLAETLGGRPERLEARPEEVSPPAGLPPGLLEGLATKLALAQGMARTAYLVAVRYAGGGAGHLLAIVDARPGSEPALGDAVAEALVFSGIEAGALDVGFFAASDPIVARLARVGIRFDIPVPEAPAAADVAPPGSDPDTPPRLR